MFALVMFIYIAIVYICI